jgi:hypothetical protein
MGVNPIPNRLNQHLPCSVQVESYLGGKKPIHMMGHDFELGSVIPQMKDTPSVLTFSWNLSLQVDRNQVHGLYQTMQMMPIFVFLEYGPGEGMGVAKTTDGGVTWHSPTQASDTVGDLDDKETMCVDAAGNLYMMWDHFYNDRENTQLVFTKSTNGGVSFQPTQVLGEWEDRG